MYVANIAQELYSELGEPEDINIPVIAFWLRTNLGRLSAYSCTNFTINQTTYEITPDLSHTEKDILKTLYVIYYYAKLIRDNLGAASVSSLIEVDSDGSKIRRTSRNDIAKTYILVKNAAENDLKQLVNDYKYCKGIDGIKGGNLVSFNNSYYSCSWKNCIVKRGCC
ncbi:MAG: hypothetical protein EKK57_08925 [Proteobacteria bacterium]|nr:MAG: hypothetical protein EKK57_08925 [Pseudomonadota bacterium]